MRAIILHRRAARYLSRMPRDRAAQVRDALREVAGLDDIASHHHIKQMIARGRGAKATTTPGWGFL